MVNIMKRVTHLNILCLLLATYVDTIVGQYKCPAAELLTPCYCFTNGNIYCRGETDINLKSVFRAVSDNVESANDKNFNDLHIENKVIAELSDDILGDLVFDKIYIEGAKNLSKISTKAFSKQTHTKRIHFLYSPLSNVPPNYDMFQALSYMTSLEIVDINSANIIDLPSNAFSVNSAVSNAFQSVISIIIRDSVRTVGNYAFNGLNNLLEVNLMHNSIDYIGAHAFHFDNPSDKKLDIELSNNTLNGTSFALGAFANVNRPYKLWLRYNSQLTFLDQNIFAAVLESGNEIHLLGTPLVCDCKNAWLYKKRTQYQNQIYEAYCMIDQRSLFVDNRVIFNDCP